MLVVEAWLVWRSKADWGFERRYESDNLIAAWATPHFSPLASHLRPAQQDMRFRGRPHPMFLHSWRWGSSATRSARIHYARHTAGEITCALAVP